MWIVACYDDSDSKPCIRYEFTLELTPAKGLCVQHVMAKQSETKIDTHQALLAVNAVLTNGHSSEAGTSWRGLTVTSDIDGYTVTLSDDQVELRLLFHNKFQLKCPNRYAQIAFIEKLTKVVRANKNTRN